jgi:hypothetical protein
MLLKKLLTAIAVLFCMTAAYNQPITRQVAVAIVKNQIIGNDTVNFNIYMYPSVYTINYCVTRNNDTIWNPYAFSRLFFIDKMPEYNWGHDCSYIFIDTITGNHQQFNNHFFSFDYKDLMDSISIAFHEPPVIPIIPPSTSTVYTNSFDPNKFALIFSGDEKDLRWNDLSHMYSALKFNGYTDENIFVFFPEEATNWSFDLDKDEIDDVDGYCTYENIENTLINLQLILNEDDIFFFYCTSHGETDDHAGNSSIVLEDDTKELTDDDLADMVSAFDCSEMVFLLDACYSGGFKPELEGDHRTVQTCTDDSNVVYIQGGLGYNTLTYAYATALKGCHPICQPSKQTWTKNCITGTIGEQDLGEVFNLWETKEDINPDEFEHNGNGDGFYDLGEAFRYASYFSWQVSTQGENYQNHGFTEDILSINGILGKVENSQTVEGSFLIGGPLSMEPGVDLSLDDDGRFYLNDAEITVSSTASLTLGENTLVSGDPGGVLDVDGELFTGTDDAFSAAGGSNLTIQLASEPFEIHHGTFTNCILDSHADPLEISDCFFQNSYIEHYTHDVDISESGFINSSISAVHFSMSYPPLENTFTITNCSFHTAYEDANSVIDLYGYRNFAINDNSIDNENNPEDVANGISIHFAGGVENVNTHEIIGNEIFCSSGNCDNDLTGITVYSSLAEISNNNIHDNQIGLQSLNFSNIQVLGNKDASFEHETQRIKHNQSCQMFASANAFPVKTSWNSIYSTHLNDCFIVHDIDIQILPPNVDVAYNFWGSGFVAERNLCPPDHYDYKPEWVLQEENELLSPSQQLYISALSLIEENDYLDAELTLMNVVHLYPEQEPAKNSLKVLLTLEPLTDNDFDALKTWYLTDSVIISNEILTKLADNLANKCDENLGNYTEAISWYENKIDNPETLEDSVFAIIDLENLYLLMDSDTSQRSVAYTGKYSQFIPVSLKSHMDHRDQLIAMLHFWGNEQEYPEDQLNEDFTEDNFCLSIAPNPFNGKTRINHTLDHDATVQIKIFNSLGQPVETITQTGKPKGNYSYEFDASELNRGIYFCTLLVNGIAAASVKMMVL